MINIIIYKITSHLDKDYYIKYTLFIHIWIIIMINFMRGYKKITINI
jgi:hypothetical protein